MIQTRLFLQAPRPSAERIYEACERIFEEDAYPLANIEIDEASQLFEVSVYCTDPDRDQARMRAALAEGEDWEIRRETLPDIDWVAKSLEGLGPVRAGRFLVHGSHDRGRRKANDIAIEIDAGRAFGTGHHGTTAGCLAAIGDVVAREHPANALDLGTGSAVLAIAVARLARIPVIATDIDPVAVEVSRQNIRLNGVDSLVRAVTADGFAHPLLRGRKFDLIVANILAGPLVALAPAMARHLAAGGSLILSGILARQRWRVVSAYASQGFRHVRTRLAGEWVTLHLKR